ncbi:hypothetical protein AO364_1050 [Moraxella catarrhalis]|nr:hypothetical protein AO364_1050 [Moraxella catarrhalis]
MTHTKHQSNYQPIKERVKQHFSHDYHRLAIKNHSAHHDLTYNEFTNSGFLSK